MRAGGYALTVSGLVLFAAACSSTPPIEPPPAEFSDRPPLANCGQTTVRSPNSTSDDLLPQRAIDCLINSRNHGGGSELAVTANTTDGDPITTYYRIIDNTFTVEIYVDRSRDKYNGGPGWLHVTCEVPILTADALRACTSNL